MSLRQFYHGYHIVLRSDFHINAELTFNVFHPINTMQIVLVKLALLPLKLVQTVRVTRRVSYNKQVLLSLRVNFGSPNLCLLVGSVHLSIFLCCGVCLCTLSCVYNVACVSGLSIHHCSFRFLQRVLFLYLYIQLYVK